MAASITDCFNSATKAVEVSKWHALTDRNKLESNRRATVQESADAKVRTEAAVNEMRKRLEKEMQEEMIAEQSDKDEAQRR